MNCFSSHASAYLEAPLTSKRRNENQSIMERILKYTQNTPNESDLKSTFDHSNLDANIAECGVFVFGGVDFCKNGLHKYIDAGLFLDFSWTFLGH